MENTVIALVYKPFSPKYIQAKINKGERMPKGILF